MSHGSRKDADGTATFAYDKAGNMTSAKDGNGTVAFAFDAFPHYQGYE
ncbi:hypothetical protein [Agathobaculum butyriciproducens]